MKTNIFDGLFCRCGRRFRSYGAEARHRHNFPLLCKPTRVPKRKIKTREHHGTYSARNYPL